MINPAIQNLEHDHTCILRLISMMEKLMLASPKADDLDLIVELMCEVMKGLQQSKEEQWLFPFMVNNKHFR